MAIVELNFVTLSRCQIYDAGDEGIGVLLETRPDPATGHVQKMGLLLNEDTGSSLLQELSAAIERKYPPQPATRH